MPETLTAERHPDFKTAQRTFRILLRGHTDPGKQLMQDWWQEALAKDPTGLQCVRLLHDLKARSKPMRS